MSWKNNNGPMGTPESFGMLGGDAETPEGRAKNLRDQQMMDLILSAMLSSQGRDKYRARDTGAPAAPTPPPAPTPQGDIGSGVDAIKEKKKTLEEKKKEYGI
jgi:hypothetical protein